jgi:hypothetical protein
VEAGAQVRELEALMAELVDAEELGKKEAKVRELEALVAEMVDYDADELLVGGCTS